LNSAEQDEQAQHEGQDAQGLGQGGAEDEVGELATGRRRVARPAPMNLAASASMILVLVE
jgi:hypothetical protein